MLRAAVLRHLGTVSASGRVCMSLSESIDEWAAQISFTLFLLFDFVDPVHLEEIVHKSHAVFMEFPWGDID